jgi:hypothetical protein
LPAHKIGRNACQPIVSTFGPTVIEDDVSTLDEASLAQALPK